MHIFLTGDRGVGKSTLLKKYIDEQIRKNPTLRIAGFSTQNKDLDILMCSISDPSISFAVGKRKIGGYREVFDTDGVHLLQREEALNPDIFIMDEIGFFESDADDFSSEILHALDTQKLVLGVLRSGCDTALIKEIRRRADTEIIEVTLKYSN